MVDIAPGVGITFIKRQELADIKLGDSLGKVLAQLQDSLSIFGTLKLVVPPVMDADT